MKEKPGDDAAVRRIACNAQWDDSDPMDCLDFDGTPAMFYHCKNGSNNNSDLIAASIERFLNGNVV